MQRKIKNQIIQAILTNDAEQVRRLIAENSVDINTAFNAQKVTLLMMAAKENVVNVVRTLLAMGADVSMSDYIGRTASDYAIKYGSDLATIILINEEVKTNVYLGAFADVAFCEANG